MVSAVIRNVERCRRCSLRLCVGKDGHCVYCVAVVLQTVGRGRYRAHIDALEKYPIPFSFKELEASHG